ncbi:inner membrane protein YpjD [Shewanella intestini]|uniref:Cytochrome c biogenesis protein CcsA n=1 Tax=Shewanella intestini TaxID=2017544 RepID=A0ABS5HY75_9GAMM|nr:MULTISPECIES: cytochrome c biogenesis protein CcsA [Shewanella]MBR9726657.1 cytochrome c biogenesis protein CcsA [Shewanella intestini]MRG34777.1 cytochrome C assembly protein [Shewanella sp. XMDDZSB0408]
MVVFSTAAMLLYCISLLLVSSRLFHADGPNRQLVMGVSAIAVGLHGLALYCVVFTPQGLNYSLTNVISIINWIIALSFTLVITRLKVIVVVPVVYACSIISVALLWLPEQNAIEPLASHPSVLVHIVLSLIGYSALMIAALYAIQMYLIQKKLKEKTLIMSPSMPPLMTVEKQLYHLVLIGFIFLTLSLISGFIFLDDMFQDGKGHKTVLSLIAWCVYGTMLWQQRTIGCRTRTAVIYCLSGGFLLSLGYFGARVVKELILN